MRVLFFLAFAGFAFAQGTQPKAKADDYETSGAAGRVEVGTEYMVHSYSSGDRTFIVPEYLVIEAALFPKKGEPVTASQGEFTLRVDGKVIRTASASEVVTAVERRGYTQQRGISGGAGPVIFGGPRQQTPPYGGGGQMPRPPRAPDPDYRGNVPQSEAATPSEVVTSTAFPDGTFQGAVSGYLYFAFKGNASKIRSAELIYRGLTLKLK